MTPDLPVPDNPQPITVVQIADELGVHRQTVETLAARLKLGTWGRAKKGYGYLFTPEEAEQLRALVKRRLEERRRPAR